MDCFFNECGYNTNYCNPNYCNANYFNANYCNPNYCNGPDLESFSDHCDQGCGCCAGCDFNINDTHGVAPLSAHDHEYSGSTFFAECNNERHNHHFAGVTGPAKPTCGGHVHEFSGRTDYADGHSHFENGVTGPAIYVGNGKHVHYVTLVSTRADDHCHRTQFATLIENPTNTH